MYFFIFQDFINMNLNFLFPSYDLGLLRLIKAFKINFLFIYLHFISGFLLLFFNLITYNY